MPSGTGITADTPVNLVVGAGVFLRDHAYLGATIDNNLFGVERTLFTPELNGIMGDLQGTDYINRSVPRLEATLPEIGSAVITTSIPGAAVDTSTPGMTIISDATTRRIADASYHDYELDVDRLNGGQFQFEVDNALHLGGFEGELQDDGLFSPRIIVTGRRSAASPSTSDWRIRILDVAS
jgi:hypothetical protein